MLCLGRAPFAHGLLLLLMMMMCICKCLCELWLTSSLSALLFLYLRAIQLSTLLVSSAVLTAVC
jgi:hypothetical protein